MAETPFTVRGHLYNSAEHAYQSIKLVALGRFILARQVRQAPTPRDAKRIAGRITQAEKRHWKLNQRKHLAIMLEILKEKYDQVEAFRIELSSHVDDQFLEETYDRYWGIGIKRPQADQVTLRELPGGNWMGKLLMLTARHKAGQTGLRLVTLYWYDDLN
jgi:ribA/ribD-fused uncharacterized protein